MKLAEELKELAKSSREARLQSSAKENADAIRQEGRRLALLGISCMQLENLHIDPWNKEMLTLTKKLLEEDGFWVILDDKTFAMSWG